MNKFKNYMINPPLSFVSSSKDFIITLKFIKEDVYLMMNLSNNCYQSIIHVHTRSSIIYNLGDWLYNIFSNNFHLD